MKKTVKGWISVGSNGKPFFFAAGPVYQSYGPLFHVYQHKTFTLENEHLIPCTITYEIKRSKERRKS